MNLTSRQRKILVGILVSRDEMAAKPRRYHNRDWAVIAERREIEHALQGKVKGDPCRWLGEAMNPSLATMVSRAYLQLQTKGLIMRHACAWSPNYTTHLSLSEEGERIARELLSQEAPTDG